MMAVYMGRMGVAARIYATALSMMMFILLAMHFYLQDWSQKQAEAWVATWEKTYHAHVEQVNLHMLRGALKLKDVRWQSDDVSINIPVLLVHGAFSGTLDQVKIIDMNVHEPQLQFSQAWIQNMWQHKDTLLSQLPWSPMLASLQAVKVNGLYASLLGKQEKLPVLNCQWSNMPRAWSCDGQNQQGGTLQVKASGQSGDVTWSAMQDDVWMDMAGLPSQAGLWQGDAHWQSNQLTGQATWSSNDVHVKNGRWVWHGKKEGETWQTRLYLKDAPLHMFANKVPHLFGQAWQQGFATGNVDIINGAMTSNILTLEDALFQGKDTSSLRLNHIQLSHVQLDTYAQTLKAESMVVKGGSWHVQNLLPDAQQDQPSPWTVTIPKISWQGLVWQNLQHNLMLSDVYGDASWQQHQWHVHAYQSNEEGQWHIASKQHSDQKVSFEIHAQHVPLRLMRSLLPKPVQVSDVSGDVAVDLQGYVSFTSWQLEGDVFVDHFRWQDAGNVWKAKHVSFYHMNMSESKPLNIQRMDVQDWTGLISMQPWLQAGDMPHTEKTMAFWLGDWQVDQLHIAQGDLSIGQVDQVWFHAQSMDLSPIKFGESMDVVVQGHLAEGSFQWQGQWSPWLPQPWFSAEISLQNALPFIAKDWLHLSGLPSFTQGRVSLGMTIHPDETSKQYKGVLNVNFQHAKLEQSLIPNARFEMLTAYAPDALFQRIAPQGSLSTEKRFDGLSLNQGFQLGVFGHILLEDWVKQAQYASFQYSAKIVHDEVSIRLRMPSATRKDHFKYNERVRLRKILHALQRNPKWYVVLIPMLGESKLDETMVQKVRQTQRKIEGFLIKRGIAMSRIVPRSPENIQRMGDMTGIQLQLM